MEVSMDTIEYVYENVSHIKKNLGNQEYIKLNLLLIWKNLFLLVVKSHGEFLSRNFESSYFKISLDWVLLGCPSPHSKNVYLKKNRYGFFEKSAHSAYFS